MAEPGELSLNRAGRERGTAEPEKEAGSKKTPYPLLPMVLLMTVTVGQRLASQEHLQFLLKTLSPAMRLQDCRQC